MYRTVHTITFDTPATVIVIKVGEKPIHYLYKHIDERDVLFNDTISLYNYGYTGVANNVKNHIDSEIETHCHHSMDYSF